MSNPLGLLGHASCSAAGEGENPAQVRFIVIAIAQKGFIVMVIDISKGGFIVIVIAGEGENLAQVRLEGKIQAQVVVDVAKRHTSSSIYCC